MHQEHTSRSPTSSGLEYSIISVQRLLHLIVPKFYRAENEDASRFMLSSTRQLLLDVLNVHNEYQLALHQQVQFIVQANKHPYM